MFNKNSFLEWSIIGSKEQYLKSALLDETLDEVTQNRIRKLLHNMSLKDEFESNEIHSYSSYVKHRQTSKQSKVQIDKILKILNLTFSLTKVRLWIIGEKIWFFEKSNKDLSQERGF